MPSNAFRDMVKEDIPPQQHIESTKKDRVKDFWYYNRFKIFVVIAVLAFVGYFVYEITTNVKPDLNIAILTEQQYISNEVMDALTNDFTQHCEDYNGDGQVLVYLNLYNPVIGEGAETADPNMQMAAVTKLSADLSSMTSTIFLTDNYDESQEAYKLFSDVSDATMLAVSQQDAGVYLSETGLTSQPTEFSDDITATQYSDFYDEFIITTRILPDDLKDDQLIDYENSLKTYNSIMGQ